MMLSLRLLQTAVIPMQDSDLYIKESLVVAASEAAVAGDLQCTDAARGPGSLVLWVFSGFPSPRGDDWWCSSMFCIQLDLVSIIYEFMLEALIFFFDLPDVLGTCSA